MFRVKFSCLRIRRSVESFTAAGLCAVLLTGPLPAAAAKKKKLVPVENQLQGDERILHALNRLTFGPRPGDLAQVRTVGLDRWLDEQLRPNTIDDSALEDRLVNYPAIRLQPAELARRYPNPQILRLVTAGRLPMPTDPVEAAIYRDSIVRYEEQKAKQEAQQKAAASQNDGPAIANVTSSKQTIDKQTMEKSDGDQVTALPGDSVDPATPAMSAHEQQLYSGLEAVKIVNLPPQQRMQRILAMKPDEVTAFRKSLTPAELLAAFDGLTPEQREVFAMLGGGLGAGPRLVGSEAIASRLLRDIYSQRQLEAVMTDFWLNHFNVYIRKNQNEPYLLASYERDVVRPRALGKFEDLLVATAKSPAMLVYLDNAQSIGPNSIAAQRAARAQALLPANAVQSKRPAGLNENYARELMELHTLGVNGGYTQADVTQVAKVFTGWTVEALRGGDFQFEERRHEPGSKTVLGTTIHESGEREGLEVLHMLSTSPATARFISNKLAVRFVNDTPPPALVDAMAKAWLASDGDIATVLRAMFNAPEFWSPQVYRTKMKTPLEFVVSSLRAANAEVNNALPLAAALDRLGMPLYGMQTPNGYSWMAEPWVSTSALVNRMNFAVALSGERINGAFIDWTSLLSSPAISVQPVAMSGDAGSSAAAAKEAHLEALLFGQLVSTQTRETVLKQLDQPAQQEAEKQFSIRPRDAEPMGLVLSAAGPAQQAHPPVDREAAVMAGLLLGSPEFQRR